MLTRSLNDQRGAQPGPARGALRAQVEGAGGQHKPDGHQQHPGEGGKDACCASQLRADEDGQVHVARAGHDLAERVAGEELSVVEPASAGYDLSADPGGEAAAETHHAQREEAVEQGGKGGVRLG